MAIVLEKLCGATDGLGLFEDEGDHEPYGRCTLPRGHAPEGWGWHQERRDGRLRAEWRGPSPGTACNICGKDGSEH